MACDLFVACSSKVVQGVALMTTASVELSWSAAAMRGKSKRGEWDYLITFSMSVFALRLAISALTEIHSLRKILLQGEALEVRDLQPGDHILRSHAFGVKGLTHHGIYVGDGCVVHTSGTLGNVVIVKDTLQEFSHPTKQKRSLESLFTSASSGAGLARFESDASNRTILKRVYPSSPRKRCNDKDEIKEAICAAALAKVGNKYRYDLFTANCETFAYACARLSENPISLQGQILARVFQVSLAAVVSFFAFGVYHGQRSVATMEGFVIVLMALIFIATKICKHDLDESYDVRVNSC